METIANGVTVLEEVYRTLHHSREGAFFLGDALFAIYIERLSTGREPLVLGQDGKVVRAPRGGDHSPESWSRKVTLTPVGTAVLEGAADHVRINGIDRWLGGVHLTGAEAKYRWDESGQGLQV